MVFGTDCKSDGQSCVDDRMDTIPQVLILEATRRALARIILIIHLHNNTKGD
jgi:hypothetical protein